MQRAEASFRSRNTAFHLSNETTCRVKELFVLERWGETPICYRITRIQSETYVPRSHDVEQDTRHKDVLPFRSQAREFWWQPCYLLFDREETPWQAWYDECVVQCEEQGTYTAKDAKAHGRLAKVSTNEFEAN